MTQFTAEAKSRLEEQIIKRTARMRATVAMVDDWTELRPTAPRKTRHLELVA